MPSYLHPGVYVEEIPSGVKPIEGVGTSTAAFIGYTTKGPVEEPELILKFDDYVNDYGGLRDLGGGAVGDRMGLAVAAFFQNGGTKAYIVRMAVDDSSGSSLTRAVGRLRSPDDPDDVFEFAGVNPGAWANGLRVAIAPREAVAGFYILSIGREDSQGNFRVDERFEVSLDDASPRFIENAVNGISTLVTVTTRTSADVGDFDESYLLGTSTSGDLLAAALDFSGLSATQRTLAIDLDGGASVFTVGVPATDFSGDLASVATAIEDAVRDGASATRRTEFTAVAVDDQLILTSGSRETDSSVVVTDSGLATNLLLGTANEGVERTGAEHLAATGSASDELAGGADGEAAPVARYTAVLGALEKIRDANTILVPDHAWDSAGKPFLQAAVAHAEKMRNRMVMIDPPPGSSAELKTEKDVTDLGLPTSTYTVTYYPWVKVANPFYDEEDNPGVQTTLLAPPGGYAAGIWAKIDGKRGVWKAPAGLETQLLGLAGFEHQVEEGEQDQLNPLGVNAYRTMPGFGPVIWGARTLSTRADPEWRYVPVRRTALFIEQSVYNGIQWAVFEPNGHNLWASLRLNIGSFMDGLFRASAFQGAKASDAYFVRCGLGDTMTQGDIDRGQVIAIVGFAPLKPAEFVIVRIQQKVAQQ